MLYFDNPDKPFKGRVKLKQHLENLVRDEQFLSELTVWRLLVSEDTKASSRIKNLYGEYRSYVGKVKKEKRYLSRKDSYKLKKQICWKYGLDSTWFDLLAFRVLGQEDFYNNPTFATCLLVDQDDREKTMDIHQYHSGELEGIDHAAYPVWLKIHRYASKRDILDFIEKAWPDIEHHQTKKRFRTIKLNRKMVDFIWKNRSLNRKKLKKELDVAFPSNDLAYFEINKIISNEKKQRGQDAEMSDLILPYLDKVTKILNKRKNKI